MNRMLYFWLATVLAAEADRFDEWDKNRDGRLAKSELPGPAQRNFERVDSNRDGSISRAEHEAFLNRRDPREAGAAGPGGGR